MRLHEVYLTDLSRAGGSLIIEGKPVLCIPFFRRYYKAGIFYDGKHIAARVCKFSSGNTKILSMRGEKTDKLLAAIDYAKSEKPIQTMTRELLGYLYYISTPALAICACISVAAARYGMLAIALISMFCVRSMFIYARNNY